MVDILKYILLGLVQGVSEVLPISSSGHLVIAQDILMINDNSLTFEIFLHLASLIAVIFYLRHKIVSLISGFCKYVFQKNKDYYLEFKYCIMLVISTIPVVIFSLLFKDSIEAVGSKLWVVGILLIINGLLLFFLSRIIGNRIKEEVNYKDALVIGVFQCIGVFPGISRSGSCLCGAFTRKIEKETAADYAFLMFIPAVLGAFILEIPNFSEMVIESSTIYLYAISFLVSCLATYFSFKILLNVIKKGKIQWFGYYCILMGLFAFIYGIID